MKIPSIGNITVYNQLKELNDLNTKERLGFGNHGIKLNANVLAGAKKGNKVSGEIDDKIIQIRVETIMTKLKYGQKISPEELKFLKKHASRSYNMAVKVLKERESFHQELKTYRTKQEAERAYARRMNGYISALNVSSSAKAYGKEETGEEAEVAQMKAAAIMNEYNRFRMSAEYKRLEDEEQESKRKPLMDKTASSISRSSRPRL